MPEIYNLKFIKGRQLEMNFLCSTYIGLHIAVESSKSRKSTYQIELASLILIFDVYFCYLF